jgi:hypothetical protein
MYRPSKPYWPLSRHAHGSMRFSSLRIARAIATDAAAGA